MRTLLGPLANDHNKDTVISPAPNTAQAWSFVASKRLSSPICVSDSCSFSGSAAGFDVANITLTQFSSFDLIFGFEDVRDFRKTGGTGEEPTLGLIGLASEECQEDAEFRTWE